MDKGQIITILTFFANIMLVTYITKTSLATDCFNPTNYVFTYALLFFSLLGGILSAWSNLKR